MASPAVPMTSRATVRGDTNRGRDRRLLRARVTNAEPRRTAPPGSPIRWLRPVAPIWAPRMPKVARYWATMPPPLARPASPRHRRPEPSHPVVVLRRRPIGAAFRVTPDMVAAVVGAVEAHMPAAVFQGGQHANTLTKAGLIGGPARYADIVHGPRCADPRTRGPRSSGRSPCSGCTAAPIGGTPSMMVLRAAMAVATLSTAVGLGPMASPSHYPGCSL